MRLYLVHHGDAVGPDVDPRRPLSPLGRLTTDRLAGEASRLGAQPVVVWHSGKLRSKQTAEAYWRACNALADFAATKDIQPNDPPTWMRDRLRAEERDLMIVGHYPHLPRLLALLLNEPGDSPHTFPPHGVVALETTDAGQTWVEQWRLRSNV
jgi:phosphohistidine phosphatase